MRVIGHIFEDLPERTNTQWLVGRDGEVLFLASINPSGPHVAAALSGDAVAKLSKLLVARSVPLRSLGILKVSTTPAVHDAGESAAEPDPLRSGSAPRRESPGGAR